MTALGQNFQIKGEKVIFHGQELPVRPGITPAYSPKARSNPMANKPRFLGASLLNTQQVADEHYQTQMHIA